MPTITAGLITPEPALVFLTRRDQDLVVQSRSPIRQAHVYAH
jgi:hypothetical protein